MKYYLIVGEASGDLHASHLMQSLKTYDKAAEFRYFGGDLMTAEGGTRVKHFRELAYMGFIPVLLHLPTIFRNMAMCKKDILAWQPDVVILVDYPGFNLDIAKFVHSLTPDNSGMACRPQVFYYISPKIWAWKEYRIKRIKRDVDQLYSILPFEVPFYEQKHHYPIHYVGNPTADEVRKFRTQHEETFDGFCKRYSLQNKPIIALLAGSRKQEIKDNLPAMIQATADLTADYQLLLAGAPSIPHEYYRQFLDNAPMYEYYLYYQNYKSWYRPEGYRGIIHILLKVDDELLSAYQDAQAAYEEAQGEETPDQAKIDEAKAALDAAWDAVMASKQDVIDQIASGVPVIGADGYIAESNQPVITSAKVLN